MRARPKPLDRTELAAELETIERERAALLNRLELSQMDERIVGTNGLSVSTPQHRTPRPPRPQARPLAEIWLSALRSASFFRSGRTSALRPRARR